MAINDQLLPTLINAPDFEPQQMGASFWYEAYLKQKQENVELEAKLGLLEKELEQLKEKLNKLNLRSSENSSQPPSQDGYKKKNKGFETKVKKKRGPKYGHEGTTRNGFEQVDNQIELNLEQCPVCSTPLDRVESAPVRRSQIAELVSQPVQVNEYQRPLYECPNCGWQGYADLPLGYREDFSYGALLSSLVGWLGYGGHLSWSKQRYLVETIFGIPMSQGSLGKMHQWFSQSLYPSYEQWWEFIQQPGVRCVDETSYRVDGVNYWLWVATSKSACVLFLAPTRSSAEVKFLLGEDFAGILSSDCWSAYSPQGALAKQKCLAHIERELKALETSGLVTTGDSFEYTSSPHPLPESDPCYPTSLHGITKLAATLQAQSVARVKQRPIVTLRLFSTYSPDDHPRRLVPITLRSALSDRPLNLSRPELPATGFT